MFTDLFYTLGLDNSTTHTLASGATSHYSILRTCLISNVGTDPVQVVQTCGYNGGFFLFVEVLGFAIFFVGIIILIIKLLNKLSH